MALKQVNYRIKGMSQDYARSMHNPETSFENKNIRLTSRENDTFLSIENERGTRKYILSDYDTYTDLQQLVTVNISGTVLGSATINDYVTIFVHNDGDALPDSIYRISNLNIIQGTGLIKKLYQGTLNFQLDAPIETLVSYENQDIQKVYWIDKYNPPRFINIVEDNTHFHSDDYFNFVNKLNLTEVIKITKNDTGDGLFPAGTVQYAFTYYNKFGQETNIFYTSPLLYSTNKDRGGSPDETVNNTFTIKVSNLDRSFNFMRIYSIIRTSIDGTPILRKVADIDTSIDNITVNITSSYISETWYQGVEIIYSTLAFPRQGDMLIADSTHSYRYKFYSADENDPIAPISYSMLFYKKLTDGSIIPLSWNSSISISQLGYEIAGVWTPVKFYQGESLIGYCPDNTVNQGFYYGDNPSTGVQLLHAELTGIELYVNQLPVGETYLTTLAPFMEGTVALETPYDENVIYQYKVVKNQPSYEQPTGNIYTINFANFNGDLETLPSTDNTTFYKLVGSTKTQLTTLSGLFLADQEALIVEGRINIDNSKDDSYVVPMGRVIITNLGSTISTTLNASNIVLNSGSISTKIQKYTLNIESSTMYIDNNTTGEIVDSTKLLYVGGEDIIVGAITQKDNTLFLGNITLKRNLISDKTLGSFVFNFQLKLMYAERSNGAYYGYIPEGIKSREYTDLYPNGNFSTQKTFKYGETYRFGIQAQHKTGKWSDVLFVTDAENTIKPYTPLGGYNLKTVQVYGSKGVLTLNNSTLISELVDQGFVRLRGVVVYPNVNERTVVAQGVVNPTLINVADKINKSADNLNSWFFRPIRTSADDNTTRFSLFNLQWCEFRHNKSIPGFGTAYSTRGPLTMNGEIQSNAGLPADLSGSNYSDFGNSYPNNFYIDQSILTFHSPDIEFDTQIQGLEGELLSMRIIGLTNMTGFKFTSGIIAGAPYDNAGGELIPSYGITNYNGAGINIGSALLWNDRIVKAKNNDDEDDQTRIDYFIYPWHGTRSLNNEPSVDGRSALLKSKQMSYFRYGGYNSYLATNWTPKNGITTLGIYIRENDNLVKIDSTYEANAKLIYQGSVDKLIGINPGLVDLMKGYPITVGYVDTAYSPSKLAYTLDNRMSKNNEAYTSDELPIKYKVGTELVRMQFKATTHGVFGMKGAGSETVVLPRIGTGVSIPTSGTLFYAGDVYKTYSQDTIDVYNAHSNGIVYIAELYRPSVSNRFGGNNKYAYQNNTWLPCGEPVALTTDGTTAKTTVDIVYSEGDTFIQRYDAIKSYAESLSQVNGVTDVLSFLVETHINLDGRYDRNRGNIDVRTTTPDNFNMLNPVYNQRNNYFNYHALDIDRYALNTFPNTFTWTKTKIAGELIDTWTNITMASTYDANGDLGPINALTLFNDQLIGFQEKGVFNILFNSRIQLNTSDGKPIELANSGKVDSVRYFSTNIGTKNKFSVRPTPAGVYFVDDDAKTINLFNGQINILSDNLGFRSWMKDNHMYDENFDVNNSLNFFTYYDKLNKDVYFINSQHALCYSELLQTFTSFYSYENNRGMFNVSDSFFSMHKDKSLINNYIYLWGHNDGSYGSLYGSNVPFYIKYLVNPEPTEDKIFDTLELRGDVFDANGNYLPGIKPLDTISAVTEYQSASHNVDNINFRQKFRVWRGLIPRANSSTSSVFMPNPNKLIGIDRIRNPWAFITLQKNADANHNRVVLQDTSFHYTV